MKKDELEDNLYKQFIKEKKYYNTPVIKKIGSLKNLTKGGNTAWDIDNLDGQLFES